MDFETRKNMSTVWKAGKFNTGQFKCEISLTQHFVSSKYLDNLDVGPVIWANINVYKDTCKSTEILSNNIHSRVYKG